MQNISIGLVILLLLGLVFLLARGGKARYPYRQRDRLFTAAEWRFYQALRAAVPENMTLFGKVRVADVLQPDKGLDRSTWQRSFNKIAGKHFDFVVVDGDSGQMRCAIELNDRSHQQRDRQERDVFLAGACEHAQLPLLMIPAARQYDTGELRIQLEEALAGERRPPARPLPAARSHRDSGNTDACCPQCGSPLVEKKARRGKHAGRTFLSCADFPRCRFSRPR